MTDRKPNASIRWLDRTILVYLDDSLTTKAPDIAMAIGEVADRAETKDQLRSQGVAPGGLAPPGHALLTTASTSTKVF